MNNRHFVILDRDGTIIVERHYLSNPEQVELLPNAALGLTQLRELGLGLIIVTNQSGVGRGYFDLAQLELIHERLHYLLARQGIILDGVFVCPHKPDDNCECRKPQIGLIKLAAQKLGFNPKESFVVGDNVCDIDLGHRVGATTFLVMTGYGNQVAAEGQVKPHYVVADLLNAAQIIQNLAAYNKGINGEKE